MCGISGIWSNPRHPHSPQTAEALTLALAHRGPDAFDHHSLAPGLTFGHRRLSVIDLSPAGAQPMVSASGRLTIVFNGEVYNFAALRSQLEREGKSPAWRGHSDTEVMLAAIEAWGLETAVTRFVGMFAFALWDSREGHLHLVRDRLGVKPLYWTRTPTALAFASEVKALRGLPGFDSTLEPAALTGFLSANCVPGNLSIYRGTQKVPPGCVVSFTAWNAAPRTLRYWDARLMALEGQARPFRGSDEEAIEQLQALLSDAVSLRIVADVPLGAFLSGGVDSSTVVALMQARSRLPVRTFSIGNESATYNEDVAARNVARHLGTQHTSLTITPKDAMEVIPLMGHIFDEPFSDSSQLPTYLVSRLARSQVTVALSGDGGDELFGGYTRHRFGPLVAAAVGLLPKTLRSTVAFGLTALSPEAWDSVFEKSPQLSRRFRLPGIRIHKLASALRAPSPRDVYEIVSSHWAEKDGLFAEAPWPSAPAPTFAGTSMEALALEMMLRDLTGYLPDDILTKVDRASMAVSLEAREPLLDHRVVEFAWTLPLHMKMRGRTGKWILRKVLDRFVPSDLISGAKMGFSVPLAAWLRGSLRPWAEELMRRERLESLGINPQVVKSRWLAFQEQGRPWEHHLWDILMLSSWADASRAAT